jgi:hypothetical protein
MSNLNDLYKESGIKPGGSDKGPIHGPSKPAGTKSNSYLISAIISAVIFIGIYVFFQTGSFNHTGLSIRNSGIFIVGLVYVVNILVRVIRRAMNK